MHQYCYGQVGQFCVLHSWVFRNHHHLSKLFQAICCPMPFHQYSNSGLKWNAPNAISHLTQMPKHTISLMSNHNFITIHFQTTCPHLVNTSWRGHLPFCTSRTHTHQSIGHVVKIIMLQVLTSNYNYIKKCKIKISITFQHFSNCLTVMLDKILQYSPGQFFGIQTTEGGSSIPHDHTNQTFKLSYRYFLLVFSVWRNYPLPCICTKNQFFLQPTPSVIC